MDKIKQTSRPLTDDCIDTISLDLHDWMIRHPLCLTEEGYDYFKDFLWQILEPYSNGHRNWN